MRTSYVWAFASVLALILGIQQDDMGSLGLAPTWIALAQLYRHHPELDK